jgi:hypothetical protein
VLQSGSGRRDKEKNPCFYLESNPGRSVSSQSLHFAFPARNKCWLRGLNAYSEVNHIDEESLRTLFQ